jgi:hypothetical protein
MGTVTLITFSTFHHISIDAHRGGGWGWRGGYETAPPNFLKEISYINVFVRKFESNSKTST